MLLGSHTLTLQPDGRLLLPAGMRFDFSGRAFVTQGLERNLWVLTPSAFTVLYDHLGQLSMTDPLARMLLRVVLGTASEQVLGADGTLVLPFPLRSFAGLDAAVTLVGQGDYLEVWSPQDWQQQLQVLQDADANAHRFAALDLSGR